MVQSSRASDLAAAERRGSQFDENSAIDERPA
jgi:hypothetical protein